MLEAVRKEFNSWHINTWLLVILVILNVLDFQTTYIAIEVQRIADEMNPVLAWAIEATGTVWVILWIKAIVLTVIVTPYYLTSEKAKVWRRPRMTWILAALNVLYAAVVISNFTHIV